MFAVSSCRHEYSFARDRAFQNRPPLGRAGGTIMKTTVDHALIRGLVTAGPVMRRGASSISYVRGQGRRRVCPSAGERAVGENRPKLRRGGSGALRRRLIKLLSAGWLPPSVSSSRGFPRSNDGRRAWPGHRAVAGSSPPFGSAPDAAQRNGSVFSPMRERPFVRSPTRKRPSRGRSPPRRPAASCRRR